MKKKSSGAIIVILITLFIIIISANSAQAANVAELEKSMLGMATVSENDSFTLQRSIR